MRNSTFLGLKDGKWHRKGGEQGIDGVVVNNPVTRVWPSGKAPKAEKFLDHWFKINA